MTLWTPAEISTGLWLDADDASTITIDTGVSVWADKSGNGRDVSQATASAQPVVSSGQLNGKDTIYFDGNDKLYADPATKLGTTAVSVISVWQLSSAGTYVRPPLALTDSTNVPRPLDRWHYSSGTNNFYIGSQFGSATLSLRTQTSAFIHELTAIKDGVSSGTHKARERKDGGTAWEASITSTYSNTSQVLSVGRRPDNATELNGYVAEIVVIDGTLSDEDRYKIEGYLAWKWGLEGSLPAGHPYKSAAPTIQDTTEVLAALDQIYNLSDPVLAALDQEYALAFEVKNALAQIWAHVLEVSLNQYYGDADQIMAALTQYYNDAPQVVQALIQKYSDMVRTSAALEQQYNLMFKAETSLEQNWAICGFQATAGLVQTWDHRLRGEVIAALGQYWGMFRDRQDVQAPLFWIIADGVLLKPSGFTWTISGGVGANQCTITLPDQGVWRSIQVRGHIDLHWNGVTYQFFVEEKTRSRSISGREFTAEYILKGLSITAALEAPYALPVTREWPENTMASVIVSELAAIEGVAVDWRIDDFPVWAGTFSVTNQTPMSAIKALVGSATVDAVVQASPEGNLIVRREITVSPPRWRETPADHVIYDDGGVFSDSDDRDVMPGYNYIEISNQIESDSRKWLEQENISSTEKLVRGYSVPWTDDLALDTSGGEWVSIIDRGIKTELISGELVEFVDGSGSLSKPFHDRDLQGVAYPLMVTWLQKDLGEVEPLSEDGELVSAVAGNSLALVTYLTKYREWLVRDQEIESVQVYIPDEEVSA